MIEDLLYLSVSAISEYIFFFLVFIWCVWLFFLNNCDNLLCSFACLANLKVKMFLLFSKVPSLILLVLLYIVNLGGLFLMPFLAPLKGFPVFVGQTAMPHLARAFKNDPHNLHIDKLHYIYVCAKTCNFS